MSDPNTITIPADLNVTAAGEWRPSRLRRYADTLTDGDYFAAAALFRYLADQIERQRPRPEGWYHVKDSHNARVLQWDGTQWSYGDGPARVDPGSTITPVTIGDPS